MNGSPTIDSFNQCLEAFEPVRYAGTRSLALYAAAITAAGEQSQRLAIRICRARGASNTQIYEVMLQSYLFLGFPRTLNAAKYLRLEAAPPQAADTVPASHDDVTVWLERGRRLCRQVYDDNYETLKNLVEEIAPEIFSWMEMEGYGKVLSRPGLDIVDREMAIIACLMLENRAPQLHSHLRGALNVGAPPLLVTDVVADLASVAGEGHATALELLDRLGVN